MNNSFSEHLQKQLADIRTAGLYKAERVITTPQNVEIRVAGGQEVEVDLPKA